jgi:hypothetical protein
MFKGVPVERVLGCLIGSGKEGRIALPHVWQLTPSKTLDSSLRCCGGEQSQLFIFLSL